MSSSSIQDLELTALKTIRDLEEAISALPPDDSKKKSGTGSKGKEKHGKEVFGLFRKRTFQQQSREYFRYPVCSRFFRSGEGRCHSA